MVNQKQKQNFDQATEPNGISRSTSPTPANTDSSADKRSRFRPSRLVVKLLAHPERKQKSVDLCHKDYPGKLGGCTHPPLTSANQPIASRCSEGKGRREGRSEAENDETAGADGSPRCDHSCVPTQPRVSTHTFRVPCP
jgi:hypothetical protein